MMLMCVCWRIQLHKQKEVLCFPTAECVCVCVCMCWLTELTKPDTMMENDEEVCSTHNILQML